LHVGIYRETCEVGCTKKNTLEQLLFRLIIFHP
jgi:hypothetical protein